MSSQVSGLIHPGFGPANIPLSGPSQARDVRWDLFRLVNEATHFRMKTDAAQRQRASETGAPGSKVGRLATGPAVVKPEADNGFRWEQQVHEPPSSESVILNGCQSQVLIATDATAPKMKSFCCGLF